MTDAVNTPWPLRSNANSAPAAAAITCAPEPRERFVNSSSTTAVAFPAPGAACGAICTDRAVTPGCGGAGATAPSASGRSDSPA